MHYLLLNLSLLIGACTCWNFSPGKKVAEVKQSSHNDDTNYGVDVTSPIHNHLDPKSFFGKRYLDTMKGCYAKYSKRECDATENQRIRMNLDQPKSEYNYTEVGFKKVRAPDSVWKALTKFYNSNVEKAHEENWPRGNTYTNHWDAPTKFIDVGDAALGGGSWLKQAIWDGVRPVIEEWTGQKIFPTSQYGIRIYTEGATLATRTSPLQLIIESLNTRSSVDL